MSYGIDTIRGRCKSLAGFIKEAWPILEPNNPYVHGWHIDLICRHLEAITFGEFLAMGLENRLLINVPPGTMKSLIVSVFWPAWEWGPAGLPGMRYLTTSYSDTNITRDSRKHRDLVESDWYQQLWPDVKLTRRGETNFANDEMGNRECRNFPSLTGGRGDRLIIDDPHSTESAEGLADRIKAIRIFRESVPNRINNAKLSAIVIIMQRLHEHDVSGVCLALGLGYTHVMLPMRFEKDRACVTPFGKDPRTIDGELLFPQRFSEETLERDEKAMTAYAVAGQNQQRPSARGGIMFRRSWFGICKAAPAGLRKVRGYDLAATEKKEKDTSITGPAYTCGVLLSRDQDGIFYVEHVTRYRETGATVKRNIRNTAEQDGKAVEIDLPQDPGQAGKAQAQDMIAMLAGWKAYASVESGDKVTRADPVAAQAEAGNIKVVEGPWNEAFFAELELFPAGAYKDQVDALSRAFSRHIRRKVATVVTPIIVTTERTAFGDRDAD